LNLLSRLNDRYALDGNDPNGFVGVLWSIAGIHDQVRSRPDPTAAVKIQTQFIYAAERWDSVQISK
jgi:hypothetical protein